MPLPAPDLDDRRFQDFVDDAKRLVRRRVPAWTDHNVHDPAITLIEAVATIADQLSYRLNQVPERHHRRFLDLLGITRRPPSAATAELTFRLSAPRPDLVTVPAGHRVGTPRVPGEEPIGFATLAPSHIVPVSLSELYSAPAVGDAAAPTVGADQLRNLRPLLHQGEPAACFSAVPQPGDRLYVGLSDAAPSCLISLRTDSRIDGIGVDPDHPPLYWEAYQSSGWVRCEVEQDSTGGLNRPGEILLHLPPQHTHCLINGVRAAWLRAVVTTPEPNVPAYSRTPTLTKLTASCVGATVAAIHAEHITEDVLGTAEGAAGQRFRLRHAPVLPSAEPMVIEVSSADGWQEWHQVTDFATSGRDDQHFVLDPMTGEIDFGPAVRLGDGSVRCHGRVPPEGSTVRVRDYWTGGGAIGNVGTGRLSVLRSAIPFVSSVSNRHPARGGHDGETVAEAKVRAAEALRGQDRAVTAEDYESIATHAVSGAVRVRCVPPTGPGEPVQVLVVPDVSGYGRGRIPFDALTPDEPSLATIAAALDQRRLVGVRIAVEPPRYQGVTAAVRLRSRRTDNLEEVRAAALAALYRWLHPHEGGPDGAGWPFGRAVTLGDVHAALASVPGADYVEEARLYPADPTTGARGEAVPAIELGADMLPFSYDHQVRVNEVRGPISDEPPGVLGVASALRQAIPAVYQEDPLFMLLCAAFDDLLAPLVTAVDCFDAYLDPYLAPADFLPWLAELVGYRELADHPGAAGSPGPVDDSHRTQIASAVRDHTRLGTPQRIREAVACAVGVPVDRVWLDDPGGTRWSTVPGGVVGGWPASPARVRVTVPVAAQASPRIQESVRAAIDSVAGVHCAIAVDVVYAGEAARAHENGPQGTSTYGDQS